MQTHFIFPSDPLNPRATEQLFAAQRQELQRAGYSTSLCPDEVIYEGTPLRGIPPGTQVVYRGWMLKPAQYDLLVQAIVQASAVPLTSSDAYLGAHHLPNWYPLLAEFTPKTHTITLEADLEAEIRSLGWEAYFIKDYVKSLKTSLGSIIRDPAQITAVVTQMEQFRGEIEGGLCVRQVEPFVVDTERRYFVLEGTPFAATGGLMPELVREVAELVPSPFYSVDVVQREDGVLRVVEIGDGQVSDLVGWSTSDFTSMWTSVRPPC